MSVLSHEQYDCRRESAIRKNLDNEKIAVKNGLTEEQAELISDLCSVRHKMHCSGDSMYLTESADYILWEELSRLISLIEKSGLEKVRFRHLFVNFPSDIDREYELIDDNDESEEQNRELISQWMSDLNEDIEEYLRNIDRNYNTTFAPSGFQRL